MDKSPAEFSGDPETDLYVIATGLVCTSVCTSLSDTDAEAWVNREYPTGISSKWAVSDEDFADGSPNPTPCPDFAGHRHVLLNC